MELMLSNMMNYLFTQSAHLAGLFMIVALLVWLLRNKSAHVRYLLWLLILAKCLLPPLMTIPLAVLPEKSESTVVEPITPMEPEHIAVESEKALIKSDPAFAFTEPAAAPTNPGTLSMTQPEPEKNSQPATAVETLKSLSTASWFLIIWLSGTAFYYLILLIKGIRFHRKLATLRTAVDADLQQKIDSLADRFRIKVRPCVYLLSDISQPFVWGIMHGSIYLPADFAQSADESKRLSILLHEMSHVKRLDPLFNLLQIIAQGLYWFHPLVWVANGRIRAEREKCCDEIAIAKLKTTPKEYGSAIVGALTHEYQRRMGIPSLAVAGPVKNIEDRIKAIMRPGRRFTARPTLLTLLIVLLLAAIIAPTTIALTNRSSQTLDDAGDKAFVATLPDDVTVELVGVCQYPGSGLWWKPDGTVFQPDLKLDKKEELLAKKPYAIVIRVSDADFSARFKSDEFQSYSVMGVRNLNDNTLKNYQVFTPDIKEGAIFSDLDVGIASGPWQTIAEYDGGHEFEAGEVLFSEPVATEDGTQIIATGEFDFSGVRRFVALDQAGTQYQGNWSGRSSGDRTIAQGKFYNIKPEQITTYQIQYRPYQWAAFHKIALQPGIKTDVTVTGANTEQAEAQAVAISQQDYSVHIYDVQHHLDLQNQRNRQNNKGQEVPPVTIQTLAQEIQNNIAPESWTSRNGQGQINILNHKLMISQTSRIQRQIAEYLRHQETLLQIQLGMAEEEEVVLLPGNPDKISAIEQARSNRHSRSTTESAGPDKTGIQPGDILEISVFELYKPGEETIVRRQVTEKGRLAVPGLDVTLEVQGMPLNHLHESLKQAYRGVLKEPRVAVINLGPLSAKEVGYSYSPQGQTRRVSQPSTKTEVHIQAQDYKADVPGIGTVRLVSVCPRQEQDEHIGWSPDGNPLAETLYGYDYLPPEGDAGSFSFVLQSEVDIEINEVQSDPLYKSRRNWRLNNMVFGQDDNRFSTRDNQYYYTLMTLLKPGFATVDLTLQLQADRWTRRVQYDGKYIIGPVDDRVQFIESYDSAGGAKVVFDHDYEDMDIRVQAQYGPESDDNWNGSRTVTARVSVVTDGQGNRHHVAIFSDITLARIKRIMLSTRPQEYTWVTFKNVALQPIVGVGANIEIKQDDKVKSFLLKQNSRQRYCDFDRQWPTRINLGSSIAGTPKLRRESVDLFLSREPANTTGDAPGLAFVKSFSMAVGTLRLPVPETTPLNDIPIQDIVGSLGHTVIALNESQVIAAYSTHGTYAFQTQEGTVGVFRIRWETEDSCTVEYRLIPELSAQEKMYSWGPVGEGLSCRLQPYNPQGMGNTSLWISMDLRNESDQAYSFVFLPAANCEVEVDGQWYGYAEPLAIDHPEQSLGANRIILQAIILSLQELDSSWALPATGKPLRHAPGIAEAWGECLELTPGQHTVRIRFRPQEWMEGYLKGQVEPFIVSNPLVVEIPEAGFTSDQFKAVQNNNIALIDRLLGNWFMYCREDKSVEASRLWHPVDSDGDIYKETRQVLKAEPGWVFGGVKEVLFFEDDGEQKAIALSDGFAAADEAFGEKSVIVWDLIRPAGDPWKITQSSFVKLAKWEFAMRSFYLQQHPQTTVWKRGESDRQALTDFAGSRQVVGKVLGRMIYRDEMEPSADMITQYKSQMTEEQYTQWLEQYRQSKIRSLIGKPLWDAYAQAHKIEATEADIEAFMQARRRQDERLKTRWQQELKELRKELEGDEVDDVRRRDIETQIKRREKFLEAGQRLDNPPEEKAIDADVTLRQVAKTVIRAWKTNQALYHQYGGRVIFQQAGPEPLDAYRDFLREQEAAGQFEITDSQTADRFWNYYTNDEMHIFLQDEDEVQKAMETPWWLMDELTEER